jgi:uncharacterized membrane protein YjgN (DUF898 family)
MNEVLLIYIYSIWDNLSTLVLILTLLVVGTVIVLIFNAWINAEFDGNEKLTDEHSFRLARKLKWWVVALVLLHTLMPSKNTFVLMVAAPSVVQIANDVADSNRTKSIVNILDNSINYLEKKSEELR